MKKVFISVLTAASLLLSIAVATADWNPYDKQQEEQAVKDTINRFLQLDPSLKDFFDKSAGYIVFPTVGKGGFIAGVGYGRGWFFEGGKPIGKASILQLSAGALIGGQAYSEIIFFGDRARVDEFKYQQFELGAQATAVALTEGVGKATTYREGVAVFILPTAGLMADASISGQRIAFEPFRP